MLCTSSVDFPKATASGGPPGAHVWSLPCCSRTASAVESRSPSIALISAMAWVTLFFLVIAYPGYLSSAVSVCYRFQKLDPRPFSNIPGKDDVLPGPFRKLGPQDRGPMGRL